MKNGKCVECVMNWGVGVLSALTLLLIIGGVYTNVYFWIDWMSFFIVLGVVLLSSVISLLVGAIGALLFDKSKRVHWGNKSNFVVLCNICISASLSVMLWYHHALTPDHKGFWWPCLPQVSMIVPVFITTVLLIAIFIAYRKDCIARATFLSALKKKWASYVLGDELSVFKKNVNGFRKQMNLHFAQMCCMRMLPLSLVRWEIVDEYVDKIDSVLDANTDESVKRKLAKEPCPSFAEIEPVFQIKGERVGAVIRLMATGEAQLEWDGNSVDLIKTWKALFSEIGRKVQV